MKTLLTLCSLTLAISTATAAQPPAAERQLLWGDTHLHTSNSFDVYVFGTPNATLDDAYRFAKGQPVINTATNTRWQMDAPLDFLVVADHAEMMGSMGRLFKGDPKLVDTKTGKIALNLAPQQTDEQLLKVYGMLVNAGIGVENEWGLTPVDAYKDMHGGDKREATWKDYIATADRYNEPGKFTAFIGWEWSSQPEGGNLHRVVLTPDSADKAQNYLPFSMLESQNVEDLWSWLDKTASAYDTDFLAIPHNPNISNGTMFPLVTQSGEPVGAGYAQTRMRWEKMVEVTQIKGDSETHPTLSPADEYADFETFEFLLRPDGMMAQVSEADYARSGLKRGLALQQSTGANPFKFGMIGSTDSHTGLAAVEENNFSGKNKHDAHAVDRPKPTGLGASKGWNMSASGYVAAWADENTRQALFEAFQRREVYATSGPRMSLRFFGGYDFDKSDAKSGKLVVTGYKKGVPMGGDILRHKKNRAPEFLIQATKDPRGANLDRVQVVKGWVDSEGNTHEKVFNVAASDNRSINDNKLAPVGNTVDISSGRYTNSIGAVELATYWKDPEFNPDQAAFYYVRVLEIPTPRYSLLDAIALGIDVSETGYPATIQERAYSSPIWYTP